MKISFNYFEKNYINLLIIFSSIFLSIANTYIQSSIDNALVFSGIVSSPDNLSGHMGSLKKSFSYIIYLQAILLKLNLNIYRISQITIFLITLCFFYGIYFIILNLTKEIFNKCSRIFPFLFTLLIILFNLKFPHTDYPNSFFASNTIGVFAIALSTLVFGLVISNKFKLSGFFSFILLGVHGYHGVWIIGVLSATLIFTKIVYKQSLELIEFTKGSILGFLIFILFLIIYYISNSDINLIGASSYDQSLLKSWFVNWESHRNISEIQFGYIKKTIFLFILCFVAILLGNKNLPRKIWIFLLFAITSIFLSSAVYFFYKIFLNFMPVRIVSIMPTRFINTHALIGYPLIICLLGVILKQLSKIFKINKILLLTPAFFIVFIFLLLNHDYKNLNERFKNIYKNRIEKNYFNFIYNLNHTKISLEDQIFWNKVKKLDQNNYTLVTESTGNYSFRYGLRPIILEPTSFDYVYYRLENLEITKVIIEEIYNISFVKPKIKFNDASIHEKFTKEEFQRKKYNDWKIIFNKFNIKYLIVPNNWKIDLKLKFNNKNYALYSDQ